MGSMLSPSVSVTLHPLPVVVIRPAALGITVRRVDTLPQAPVRTARGLLGLAVGTPVDGIDVVPAPGAVARAVAVGDDTLRGANLTHAGHCRPCPATRAVPSPRKPPSPTRPR